MKLVLASDHRGLELKRQLMEYLAQQGHELFDVGTYTVDSVDYPVYAEKACVAVTSGEAERAILVCGTGFGISLAANQIDGIRAVNCSDVYTARMTRRHNNANVISIGADVVGTGLARLLIDTFLSTPFDGGRHQKRLDMVAELRADVTGKSVLIPFNGRELKLYNQRSLLWTEVPYPFPVSERDGNLKTSGCGVFSTCEVIEFFSGERVRPEALADFAMKNGARVEDGTDRPVLLKAMQEQGLCDKYGFEYRLDGHLNDHEKLWDCILGGGAALCNLRAGHIVALAACRERQGEKQLLALDCYSESADSRVSPYVREVLPQSLIEYSVLNDGGVLVGCSQSYGAFWVPLELPRDFDLLYRKGV